MDETAVGALRHPLDRSCGKGSGICSPARGWFAERAQYNLHRRCGREDVAMPDSARMSDPFCRTVLLAFLLALLCAACNRSAEERGRSGNDLQPITTTQREEEDTADSGAAAVKRVEVSTLVTNLEVPWSFAFLPGGDALVTERDSGKLLRVSPSG